MRAFLSCLAVLFTASTASAWDLAELEMRRTENNVQIGDGCSGTIVSVEHRLILTAYHCIEDAITTEAKPRTDDNGEVIVGGDGKALTVKSKKLSRVPVIQIFWDEAGKRNDLWVFAEIVARNERLDVAILQFPEKVGPVALVTAASRSVTLLPKDAKVEVGAVVWHIGNPMMLYGSVTRGVYSGPRSLSDYGLDGVKMYIQYDGGMTGGSSGGALYDDMGRYVGTTVMGAPAATFIGLAVPTSDIWTVAEGACIADKLGGVNPAKCAKPARPVPAVPGATAR
jgi:S1-C subfamily serine protease